MMGFILSWIPGGGLTAIVGAVVAALGFVALVFRKGTVSGRDAQKAKEAENVRKDLEAVAAARRARSDIPTGGMPGDKYRRD